uniref:Uncharacterized protein n=1 Tax=Rhizophora mucronata TaxID=61149 RepID=A0A2P2PM24_RHIMU
MSAHIHFRQVTLLVTFRLIGGREGTGKENKTLIYLGKEKT